MNLPKILEDMFFFLRSFLSQRVFCKGEKRILYNNTTYLKKTPDFKNKNFMLLVEIFLQIPSGTEKQQQNHEICSSRTNLIANYQSHHAFINDIITHLSKVSQTSSNTKVTIKP